MFLPYRKVLHQLYKHEPACWLNAFMAWRGRKTLNDFGIEYIQDTVPCSAWQVELSEMLLKLEEEDCSVLDFAAQMTAFSANTLAINQQGVSLKDGTIIRINPRATLTRCMVQVNRLEVGLCIQCFKRDECTEDLERSSRHKHSFCGGAWASRAWIPSQWPHIPPLDQVHLYHINYRRTS